MTRIVIELADQHKHLASALQALAERVEQLGSQGADGKSIDYAKIEREVGAAAASAQRIKGCSPGWTSTPPKY